MQKISLQGTKSFEIKFSAARELSAKGFCLDVVYADATMKHTELINYLKLTHAVAVRSLAVSTLIVSSFAAISFFNRLNIDATDIAFIFLASLFYRILITVPAEYFNQLYKVTFIEKYRLMFELFLLGLAIDYIILSYACFFFSLKSHLFAILISLVSIPMIIIVTRLSFFNKIDNIRNKYKEYNNIFFVDVVSIAVLESWPKIIHKVSFTSLIFLGVSLIITKKMFGISTYGNIAVTCMIGVAFMYFWVHCMVTTIKNYYKIYNIIGGIRESTGKETYSDSEQKLKQDSMLRDKIFSGKGA